MDSAANQPGFSAEIGIFDSGVGGLTVLKELRALLPEADLRYLADSAHAPYGDRTADDIRQRSLQVAQHLVEAGSRLIVVACNTATAHAIEALRARWPEIAFVGIEPGIKPAVAATRNGRIGVLATPATTRSDRLHALIARYAEVGIEVCVQPCPGIVEHIESGDLGSPALRAKVDTHCAALRRAGVDTVLLGCTHYPLIEPLWRASLGPAVSILRIETAVAQRAAELWGRRGGAGRLQLECSGSPLALQSLVPHVLGARQLVVNHWQPPAAPGGR